MNWTPEQKAALRSEIVKAAASQVGVREVGGNNRGAQIEMYQSLTELEPGPWPWCAAFCAWVLFTAFVRLTLPGRTHWRCRSASAFAWEAWARSRGVHVTDEKELAKAGDFVVFDFSHIGIVEFDQLPGETTIRTIEGNTNGKGERDSTSGDGVWRKVRSTTLVKSYLRIV